MLDTAMLVTAERGITPLEDLLEDDDDVLDARWAPPRSQVCRSGQSRSGTARSLARRLEA